ncbi:MAG: hypothetical protein MJ184_09180 [Treponema sp.]|uniref:hypothetical protein n=1 Tax=Treponema sp. TaxID=166 RepID=UPI00298D81A2|nr:hypothetical protein [Treponema sp.]MCQ2601516.1 hypothetical protein [Treponema sp.]
MENTFTKSELKNFLKEFREYLCTEFVNDKHNNLSLNSARCYSYYVSKARVWLNEIEVFDEMLRNYPLNGKANFEAVEHFDYFRRELKNSLLNCTDAKQKKDLYNWFSGIQALRCYLDYKHEVNREYDTEENLESVSKYDSVQECVVVSELSHTELLNKFRSRLRTQDRYYPAFNLYFSSGIISKIFSRKDKGFGKWLTDESNKIRFLKEDGSFVLFSEIDHMEIRSDNSVYFFTKDGKDFALYTKTYDGKLKQQFSRIWDNITIDHIESMEEKLRTNKISLTGLQIVSDKWSDYRNKNNLAPRSGNNKKETVYENEFIEANKKELTGLKKSILNDLYNLDLQYELMDRSENSKKSNN